MPLLGKVWDLRKGLHWRMPLKSSWSLGPPPAVPSPFLHGVRRLPSLTTHSQTVNHPTRLLSPNPQRKLNLCTHWTWCMYLKPQHPGGYSRKMGVLGQPGGHSKSRFQRKQRDSLRYCVTVTSLTITLRRAGLSTQPHHCCPNFLQGILLLRPKAPSPFLSLFKPSCSKPHYPLPLTHPALLLMDYSIVL